MSVNKYKIRLNQGGPKLLKIPLELDFASMGQRDIVNREFVKEEVEESINPIVDYEKARFTPVLSNKTPVSDLIYKLNFLGPNGSILNGTTYGDIGFSDDDIKFQKNSFKKSFLRLSFYDFDKPTNQNLISFVTLFPKLKLSDLNPLVKNGQPNTLGGLPKAANLIPVDFSLQNPVTNPKAYAEGFYLYYFKNRIKKNDAIPVNLYMRAEFNNAATGKTTRFITTSNKLPINELINKLHVRYLLNRDSTGYDYSIDTNYQNATNIIEGNTKLTVNLYEIQAI